MTWEPKPCFACGKEIEMATAPTSDDAFNLAIPPASAVIFHAHGNYGSTIFDPMDGRTLLEILICDECMDANHDRVLIVKGHQQWELDSVETWDPDVHV